MEKSSLKKVFDEDDAFDDDWDIEISENLPEPKKEKNYHRRYTSLYQQHN
ncbi:MAG: hypothetical protein IJY69_00310 [Clostridia bacterium]|nr:hypothetical protein [Clostridia bacterium]